MESIAIMALVLAGLVAFGLVWLAAHLAETRRRDQDHIRKLHEFALKQQSHLHDMLDADFIVRTLQRHGVTPYLPLASERMAKDIESICQQFGLTEEQALQWITNQIVEKPSDGQ